MLEPALFLPINLPEKCGQNYIFVGSCNILAVLCI